MRAEDLITLAAARGVDLSHVAGNASRTDRTRSRRQRREDRHRAKHSEECPAQKGERCTCGAKNWRGLSARGSGSHSIDRPQWTIEELAQAATGVPALCFAAACYSFAGERVRYFTELWDALAGEAMHLRRRYNWPPQVKDVNGDRRYYLQELAALVLEEEAHPHLFRAAPALYPAFLHVSDTTWERPLSRRFTLVRYRYLVWRDTALSMIQSRLSEEDETPESGRKIDEPEKAA